MSHAASCPNIQMARTRAAFFWSWILNTPFWAIYGMLPFILYKDLHATPLQIGVAITLKPLVSLLAMYWSSWADRRKDRLKSNVLWANILGHAPFLLFPFIDNAWFFVFSIGFYTLMARGSKPAWMEILKLNIQGKNREKVFAYASAFEYLGGGILPLLIGWLLDGYFQAWRWICPLSAFIALIASWFQMRIQIPAPKEADKPHAQSKSLMARAVQPWIDIWNLMLRRRDFAHFQMGFMLGGAGLIVMYPALPDFFMGTLQLSYMELAIAINLCKGIGYAMASPLWARWIHKVDIYRFLSCVTFLLALFPLGLLMAQYHVAWIYGSYIGYGIMQAGSELSWNMSGPIFSKEEDSSLFSIANLLTAGLRGCVFPPFGSFLCVWASPMFVLFFGGGLCFLATLSMAFYSRKEQSYSQPVASE